MTTTEILFSYGTLQYEPVQIATFNRRLQGEPDTLVDYTLGKIAINDPAKVQLSGAKYHPIAQYTGHQGNCIAGTALRLTRHELVQADSYEVAAYKRIAVVLQSGLRAWVYVDASQLPAISRQTENNPKDN